MQNCGVCSEPFKDGEVVVQAARYQMWNKRRIDAELRAEKFWAHPVCVFRR